MDTEDPVQCASFLIFIVVIGLSITFGIKDGAKPVPPNMVDLKVEDLEEGEGGWIYTGSAKSWSFFRLNDNRILYVKDTVFVDVVVKPLEQDWDEIKFPGERYIFIYRDSQGLNMTVYGDFRWEVDDISSDYEQVQLVIRKYWTSKDKIPSFGEDKLIESEVEKTKSRW